MSNGVSKSGRESESKPKPEPEVDAIVRKPRCFVIMPISDTPEYPTGHFTRVYQELIKPAVEDANFECKRVDDDVETKVIILNILKMITEYDMAICDMSSLNPNVMYELGIRQMSKKPVTLIKDERTRRIFDTSILSDIEYDSSLRIDLARLGRERIASSLRKTYEQHDKESSSLLDLLNLQLQVSSKDVAISLPEKIILDRIEALSEQITGLQRRSLSTEKFITSTNIQSLNVFVRDANGRRISSLDILKNPAIGSYYLVRAVDVKLKNAQTVASLHLRDLKGEINITMDFEALSIPFIVVEAEELQAHNRKQFDRMKDYIVSNKVV